jgi:uncharacterized protein (TIGR02001 family)
VLTAFAGLTSRDVEAVTVGGDLAAVTDYIFRGVSENEGRPAAQMDLHIGSNNGLFAGVWGSTLSTPRADFALQPYAGMRFALSSAWSTTLSAVDYSYIHQKQGHSDDYQELSLSFAYLDALTLTLSASPNAVHYWRGLTVGRYPAYDASVTGQLSLFGPVFLTAGVGYYYLTGPSRPSWGTQGYPYGNVGLAAEYRAWRLDVGYYFAGSQAENLFPYSASNNRFAATLSWRFQAFP